MKKILLTKHNLTYVDDEAYKILSYYPWNSFVYGWKEKTTIAGRAVFLNGKRFSLYLHRLIAGVPQCFKIKWLNENRLDNRYENLQIYDKKGNKYSFVPFVGKSKFKGVKWHAYYGLWEATFCEMSVGFYNNEVDAARAYNVKIKEVYRKPGRGRLNSIPIMNKYLKNNNEE